MGLSVKWKFGSQLRRFTVKEVLGEALFVSLQNEILGIVGHAVDIYWEDDEGDLIIIQSESELAEALNYRSNEVLRLVSKEEEPRVLLEQTVQTEKSSKSDESQSERTRDQDAIPGAAHPGVTCDGCESLIFGHRFKCILCHDYDLCQKCEAQGVHGFHAMLRIVDPDITVIPWGARLRTHRRPSRQRPFEHMNNERDFHHREHPWMRRDQLKDSVNKGVQFLTELGQTVSTALSNMGIDTTYEVRVENDDKHKTSVPTQNANATAPTAPAPEPPLAPAPQLPEVPVVPNVAPPAPTTIPRVHRGQNRTDGYLLNKELNKQRKAEKCELKKFKEASMVEMFREANQQAAQQCRRSFYPTFEVRTPPTPERFETNHNYDMFGRRLRDGYPTAPTADESRAFQWRSFRDFRGRGFGPESGAVYDPFGRNEESTDNEVFGNGRAGFSPFGRHSCRQGPTVLKRSTGNELFGELDPFAPAAPAGVVAPPRKITKEEDQTTVTTEGVQNKMSEMLIDIPRQIANNNEKKAEKTIDIPNADSVAVEIKNEVVEDKEEDNLVDLNEHSGMVFRSGSESSLGSDLVNVDMTMCEIASVDHSIDDALDQLNAAELSTDASILYPELQEQNADVEIFMDAVETNPHEAVIRQLTAMGFMEPECRRAILHCGAELGKCLDFLTGSFTQ